MKPKPNVRFSSPLISRPSHASVFGKFMTVAHSVLFSIMLKKKKNKASAPPWSSILIPLYVYPSPAAWDPLISAIEAYPDLNYIVIVNPGNGPGSSTIPDANYTREILRLNCYSNVRIIGYVSTSWTDRKLASVLADIDTYAGWPIITAGIGISGIFLDETPTCYNEISVRYLECLASTIRSKANFGKDPLIIHNPGYIPDSRYMSFCDVSVVFEGSYDTFLKEEISEAILTFQSSANVGREAIGCILHHLPITFTPKETKSLIQDLRCLSNHIFLTSHFLDYYARFCPAWLSFVAEMADA